MENGVNKGREGEKRIFVSGCQIKYYKDVINIIIFTICTTLQMRSRSN